MPVYSSKLLKTRHAKMLSTKNIEKEGSVNWRNGEQEGLECRCRCQMLGTDGDDGPVIRKVIAIGLSEKG